MTIVAITDKQLQYDEEIVSDEEASDVVMEHTLPTTEAIDNDSDDNRTHPVIIGDTTALINDDDDDDQEVEEEELEDDSRQRRYERDFLLSLQFLEQCRLRPPNLINAEYIRRVCLLV